MDSEVFTYEVSQVGICNFDAYGIMWYGTYYKFYERAVQEAFGDGRLARVDWLDFRAPVRWGNHGRIEVRVLDVVVVDASASASVVMTWVVDGGVVASRLLGQVSAGRVVLPVLDAASLAPGERSLVRQQRRAVVVPASPEGVYVSNCVV
jgi:hypothetical protein